MSGFGDGERLRDGLWWLALGAALADGKVQARVLAMSPEGWPRTPGRMLAELRTSERNNLRSWLWEWMRNMGIDIPADARFVDGVLAAVEGMAQRERQVASANEVATRARLMPAADFAAWLDRMREPRAIAGKVVGA